MLRLLLTRPTPEQILCSGHATARIRRSGKSVWTRLKMGVVKDRLKVKASGGIRDIETVEAMIDAGADRLGTSKLLI